MSTDLPMKLRPRILNRALRSYGKPMIIGCIRRRLIGLAGISYDERK